MNKEKVICEDGFEISIQASRNHYCYPRLDNQGFYSHVELGFPSSKDSLIQKYAEDKTSPTDTVYGMVPIETVCKLIKKHGGIKGV